MQLGAPSHAAPPEPLDAVVSDLSTFPNVLVDILPPRRFGVQAMTADMVEISGASVDSITAVDPAGIVVGLVIDDSPTVPVDVVGANQGASVELVRNAGEGTQIAVASPSGLQSALTADRNANIARIAGITAGAPDVVPLPELVLDTARRLAQSPQHDRHLVVVQGSPIPPGPTLDQIAVVVNDAGIKLYLVAAAGLDAEPIAGIAAASGGLAPASAEPVSEMDDIAAAITGRFRVAATVTAPGPAEVALTVGGERLTAQVAFDAPPPAAAPAAPPASNAGSPAATTAVAPDATANDPATATPTTAARAAGGARGPTTSATTTTLAPDEFGPGTPGFVAIAVAALVIGALGIMLMLRRRAAHTAARPADESSDTSPLDPTAPDPSVAVDVDQASEPDTDVELVPSTDVADSPVLANTPDVEADVEPPTVAEDPVRDAEIVAGTVDHELVEADETAVEPDSEPVTDVAADPDVELPTAAEEPAAEPDSEPVTDAAEERDVETDVELPTVAEEPAVVPVVVAVLAAEQEPESVVEDAATNVEASTVDDAPVEVVEDVAVEPEPDAELPTVAQDAVPDTEAADEPAVADVAAEPDAEAGLPTMVDDPVELEPVESIDDGPPTVDRPRRRGRTLDPGPRRGAIGRQRTRDATPPRRPSPRRGTPNPPPARSPRRGRSTVEMTSDEGWLVVGDLRMRRATGEVWAGQHRVRLTPPELGVLELLMTSGGKGVTPEAILAAAELDESSPEWEGPDAIVAQLRRKTRTRGQARSVRKERVLLYFLGDEGDDADGG